MGLPVADQESPFSQQSHPLLPPAQNPYHGIPVLQEPPATYVLLPFYPRRHRRRHRRRRGCDCCASFVTVAFALLALALAFSFLFLALAFSFLFPSDPDVSVARLRLHYLHLSALPDPKLNISLSIKAMIRNRNFFSLEYHSLVVSFGYRGKRLGFVSSDGGRIRARGVSYVDTELKLDGIRIISDALYLAEDIARVSIPLDTVTEVDGQLHVLFFDVPVDGRISCVVNVNPENQTVVRQDCYPE